MLFHVRDLLPFLEETSQSVRQNSSLSHPLLRWSIKLGHCLLEDPRFLPGHRFELCVSVTLLCGFYLAGV